MKNIKSFESFNESSKNKEVTLTIKPLYYFKEKKKLGIVFRILEDSNSVATLEKSLKKIDELLDNAKKDKSIDVEDLRQERRNCAIALKKLRKEEEKGEYTVFDITGKVIKDAMKNFTKAGVDFEVSFVETPKIQNSEEAKINAILKEVKTFYNNLEIKPIGD